MRKLFLIMFSLVSVGASADTFQRYTEKEKEAINRCRNLDVKLLESIKSQMTVSAVFSGVGTAASAVSLGISASNVAGKTQSNTAKNIAGNIAAGVGTGTSVVSAATAGDALSKLKGLIDDLEECKEGLGDIADSPKPNPDNTSSESSGEKTVTTTTTVVTETTK
ncbi:MAG: hypothetical protein ACI4N3_03140 [Alphaproteobacteria bacterium]